MKRGAHSVVILLSLFALFWRLDGTVLWRDEATTACWARSMVEHRWLVPRVFDGRRLIAQAADGHDFNDHLLPVMQGWLQFYVAALGFLAAGASTVTARLPFAVAGALSLWILYRAGRELLGDSLAALAAPLAGSASIYFLTAARQCRYYILVVLFTCCILREFGRYFREPERAQEWSFYARLGACGVLVYLANYVSFGGLWLSLAVFVWLVRDCALRRGFVLLSAALAGPMAAEFFFVHAGFVAGTAAAHIGRWSDYAGAVREQGAEVFRMIPLLGILPAAWYVFFRRKQRGPAAQMALLAGCVIVISVAVTALGAKGDAIARYYFQILPAALLLIGILAERIRALLGGVRGMLGSGVFFAFALVWPNLNIYHGWSGHVVERQFLKETTVNEPIVRFLQTHVGRGETVAFYRNVQGMMAYFNLPWLQWVDLLDSNEPRNQRRRGILPAYVFDDYPGVDWYVVWDNDGKMPRELTSEYRLVWEYTYTEHQSWWDRREPARVLTYRVYRRMLYSASAPAVPTDRRPRAQQLRHALSEKSAAARGLGAQNVTE
ncbi:MAG TPA: glycosyltransferase family 39 protein [Bryobacterales bacterium]|jgi:hypothetical protein|nr:glycosyltransferase family 39 protein [Bryobacterales bacterium]